MKILVSPSSFGQCGVEPLELLKQNGYEVINNPYSRKYHTPFMEETEIRFEEVKIYFENKGVSIINAGYGSKLNVSPKINLKDLFELSYEEEKKLYFEVVKKWLPLKNEIHILDKFEYIDTLEKLNKIDTHFYTDLNFAPKIISRLILSYIPIGPFQNKYLFLKRNQI